MDFSQNLISEFMKLGNVNLKNANAALQVYLELCEVKKYWDVDYKYHSELEVMYLTAKKNKSENISIFVPLCACDELTFTKMRNYFKISNNIEINSFFLVFVTSDSTCVYYQISDGLCEPIDTTAKHSRLNKQEQRDAKIRNHRAVIAEAALCGIPLTFPDSKPEEKEKT